MSFFLGTSPQIGSRTRRWTNFRLGGAKYMFSALNVPVQIRSRQLETDSMYFFIDRQLPDLSVEILQFPFTRGAA
ncbi:hypothetical protein Pmi06nite_36590 [Planotetraspora mira]|uniref:Uncharacterized protein n=1 Tax=Planotetraspora mira TaxID=58121 RepID=A0A8J3X6V0_9ACTN|nr:hypothetical protein Pmi06nite_36590 [Planotetraspora mira]